ncbi:phosphatidate cytidylyltransferase [Rhizobiales bacterium]|uniref:phosphatidate cytidylyltransferase n=1 Tax=Hongsoonwoonella zoysiae TaxID=2821844 RepID=UPI00155FABAF|nr:phosphatidate cytidylyltransferase [Hongsoonwoonella zoysiae]NRG18699.1 phosphatidate cytidylyltransferase [Hongsoonwoonella zoysiae]
MNDGKGAGAEGTRQPSNLRLRVISALVLAPLALAAVWLGGVIFSGFVAAACLLLLREWVKIVGGSFPQVDVIASFIALFGVLVLSHFGQYLPALALLITAVLLVSVVLRFSASHKWKAEGLAYAGISGIALIALRSGEYGLYVIMFLFGVVWATDIAAYFAGRSIGGPKLWPKVSPKKTWSGAIGGLMAAFIVGAIFSALAGGVHPIAWIAAAMVLSVASQFGDLFESAVKRRFDVKDSGALIPGHGGIMDRVDGLVAGAAVFYFLAVAVTGNFADPVSELVTLYGA